MTQRPDHDTKALEAMLHHSREAAACVACPAGTRRTTRRKADGSLEVRCAGCGRELLAR